jgi:hypothetical protein
MLTVLVLSAVTWAQEDQTPKIEVFGGYAWLAPGGNAPNPCYTCLTPIISLDDLPRGMQGSFTYNFFKHFGMELQYGYNWQPDTNTAHFQSEMTGGGGPRLEIRSGRTSYFVHGLVTANYLNPFHWDNNSNKTIFAMLAPGVVAGGGMDVQATKRLAIRLFQVDWVYARQHYDPVTFPNAIYLQEPSGTGTTTYSGARLGAGLVFDFGYPPEVAPTASCAVTPAQVMVGEPVTATATPANFNPKHKLTYSWSTTGGKVAGKDTTASIDTAGIAGGNYTVTAHISDPKLKKNGEASCSAAFGVQEPRPPVMTCSASPSSLQAGGRVSVSCNCSSPDNVPVTVKGWKATGGSISGSGATATLDTTGAPAGAITVSASCSDQRGLNTQASTQVMIEAPPPPPPPAAPPQASKMTECDFSNMARIGKPWRVDNECKGKLDDVAKNLQQNLENKLVVIGNAEPREKRKNLAAERAINVKDYMTHGEAQLKIDPSRIEPRTGTAGTKSAELWVVPSGVAFTEGTPVNEAKVKAIPRGPAHHPAAKKPGKKAAAPPAP